MAVAAISSDPISFFDTSTGQELSVPISAISFDSSDALTVDPAYAPAKAWIKHLYDLGIVKKGAAPAPVAAIVFRAVDPGAAGNNVLVKISYPAGVTSKFDVEVTATSAYKGLTAATLVATLGNLATLGKIPGLLRVDDTVAPVAPRDGTVTVPLLGGTDAAGATLLAPGKTKITIGGSDAFSLQATKPGDASNKITVTVVASGGVFDLTAVWTKSKSGFAKGDVASLNTEFGYVLNASAPPTATLDLPQPGPYALSGGADAAAAVAAAVTPPAKPA